MTTVVGPNLLEGDLAPRAQVVECGVPGDPEDPGRERNLARLVLLDRGHELGEDVLRDVLGVLLVLDDAPDVAADVVGEAGVQEADPVHIALLGAPGGVSHEQRVVGMTLAGKA